LIAFDSNRAQEAVQELSKLLRHVLDNNQMTYVPLQKELDFINNYISLMRIRLPQSVKINVQLNEGNKNLHIAPLIFISLIENAFKHGVSPTEESFISISIQGHDDGNITCEIKNSYFPKDQSDKSGNGIGLEQVYRRLELSYPGNYQWSKGPSADRQTYTSCLTIQTANL
jgi:LytS/YehU family sensor histidine kinase